MIRLSFVFWLFYSKGLDFPGLITFFADLSIIFRFNTILCFVGGGKGARMDTEMTATIGIWIGAGIGSKIRSKL